MRQLMLGLIGAGIAGMISVAASAAPSLSAGDVAAQAKAGSALQEARWVQRCHTEYVRRRGEDGVLHRVAHRVCHRVWVEPTPRAYAPDHPGER